MVINNSVKFFKNGRVDIGVTNGRKSKRYKFPNFYKDFSKGIPSTYGIKQKAKNLFIKKFGE
jgi:hypothetical protein